MHNPNVCHQRFQIKNVAGAACLSRTLPLGAPHLRLAPLSNSPGTWKRNGWDGACWQFQPRHVSDQHLGVIGN